MVDLDLIFHQTPFRHGHHRHPEQNPFGNTGTDWPKFEKLLFNHTKHLERVMSVNTDALAQKIQPLSDAVDGLVTIVRNIPQQVTEAVTKALEDAAVDDGRKQAIIDEATAEAQDSTEKALAAAQENTGQTLPQPTV